MSPAADRVEALWTASILALYDKQLSDFVRYRDAFAGALCANNYPEAENQLKLIERDFGVSLWLLSNQITLLQLKFGTASQKAYLQTVVHRTGVNPLIAYMGYLFSFTAEENVSLAELTREWGRQETAKLSSDTIHYIRYHISPFDATNVVNPWACVAHEENSSIIDRYETFVEMAQLAFIRAEVAENTQYISSALSLLKKIPDRRLQNMRRLFDPSLPAEPTVNDIGLSADAALRSGYAGSRLQLTTALEARPDISSVYESVARFGLKVGNVIRVNNQFQTANALVEQFEDVIGLNEKYHQSRFALQKAALLFRRLPVARSIISFLDSGDNRLISRRWTENEAIWAISGPLGDPLQLPILRGLSDASIALICLDPSINSIANTLVRAATFTSDTSIAEIESADVAPEYRQLYLGHLAFNNGSVSEALDRYKRFQSSTNNFESIRAARFVYEAARALDDLNQALDFFTEAYLANSSVHLVFPLEDVVEWVKDNAGINETSLNRSIVLSAYLHHVSTKYDGELSDAFEDVLDYYKVDRPSELLDNVLSAADRDRWIYFLQNVCTIRRLEDSTRFLSYEDIEGERLAILTGLLTRYPCLADALSDELIELGREREIAQLAEQFDRSRIYVNELGVKQFIAVELEDAVARYSRLLRIPELQTQTVGLEELIKKILKAAGEEFDKIELPATEKDGVFFGIHDLVLDSFVLNPDHGLKTYLTTRILHGSIEGELRSSFSKQHILFSSASDGEFDSLWKSRLKVSSTDFVTLRTAVLRFSKRVSDVIIELKDKRIRIRSSATPSGIIDFDPSPDEIRALQKQVEGSSNPDDFANVIIRHLWQKVDRSLDLVREEIEVEFRKKILGAAETLRGVITLVATRSNVGRINDALTNAITEFQRSIEKVSAWFRRSGANSIGPFSIETAVQVAVRLTNSKFPTRPISPVVEAIARDAIRGNAFLPILDILTNCFQNAIEHAQFEDRAPETKVFCSSTRDSILIRVENELRKDSDRYCIESAVANVLHPTMHEPNSSGFGRGTGLREIKRILSKESAGDEDFSVLVIGGRFVISFSIGREG